MTFVMVAQDIVEMDDDGLLPIYLFDCLPSLQVWPGQRDYTEF
jgi:hypothetical protein